MIESGLFHPRLWLADSAIIVDLDFRWFWNCWEWYKKYLGVGILKWLGVILKHLGVGILKLLLGVILKAPWGGHFEIVGSDTKSTLGWAFWNCWEWYKKHLVVGILKLSVYIWFEKCCYISVMTYITLDLFVCKGLHVLWRRCRGGACLQVEGSIWVCWLKPCLIVETTLDCGVHAPVKYIHIINM